MKNQSTTLTFALEDSKNISLEFTKAEIDALQTIFAFVRHADSHHFNESTSLFECLLLFSPDELKFDVLNSINDKLY